MEPFWYENLMLLTPENYTKGFLIDDELMGGVSLDPDTPGHYLAFVVRHSTGESVGCLSYASLEGALEGLAQVRRPWKFESASGCQNENCKIGGCGGETCHGSRCKQFISNPSA